MMHYHSVDAADRAVVHMRTPECGADGLRHCPPCCSLSSIPLRHGTLLSVKSAPVDNDHYARGPVVRL